MIEEPRIKSLNRQSPVPGRYVLYWMQASQRAECNHALEYAVQQANRQRLPLIVSFGLTDRFPDANERHYRFMLEGLKEVQSTLQDRGIGMVIRKGPPENEVVEVAGDASMVICDRGYLRIQRIWREYAAARIPCPLYQVESDVIVPVETASVKEEYSAATLRRKLLPALPEYTVPLPEEAPVIDSTRMDLNGLDITDTNHVLSLLDIKRTVQPVQRFRGGTGEAKRLLELFISRKLDRYSASRNDPNQDCQSNLSPYLHFGQISPLYIALKLRQFHDENVEAFLEELVVRRELSMNYALYNPHYDSFAGLPEWAKRILKEHGTDTREYLYSQEDLELARTHDPYWNAAQTEMVTTGKMHGYMRMYWGKKILEWSADPEQAFATAVSLNNKYELDGRDPNGYAGIAWCFGKHDRPWRRRPVFGTVRYMSAGGLKRKFDIEKYARKYGEAIETGQ